MRYSFLLPAYKTAFLKVAVDSILSQTHSELNVVISDDCSPNHIKEFVDHYSDERIIYRRNTENIGSTNLVDHWNLLLSLCETEYLIMASDDDVYAPGFLEEVDKLVNKYPEADLIHVRSNSIDSLGNVLKEDYNMPEFMAYEDFLNHFLSLDSILCIGNFVFKTDVLKRAGGFIKFPLAWKSDSATQISMAGNGVVNSKDILFSFRMSGLNISSNMDHDPARDRLKLDAIVKFGDWLKNIVDQSYHLEDKDRLLMSFHHRLEGESRSYYSSLSLKEFAQLYSLFNRDHWFYSLRNRVSFAWGWIVSKLS